MNSRNVYWSYIVSLREISRVLIWLALSPTHPPRRGHLTERGGKSSRTALLLWRDFKTSLFWSKWFIHPEQSGDGTPPIHPYLAEGLVTLGLLQTVSHSHMDQFLSKKTSKYPSVRLHGVGTGGRNLSSHKIFTFELIVAHLPVDVQ